jgi:hypothetical protein
LGGYIINDESSDSEYSESIEYYFTDDLRSSVLLGSVRNIQDLENNIFQKKNNKIQVKGGYKRVKESDKKILDLSCPICLDFVERSDGCMFIMGHDCAKTGHHYNKELYLNLHHKQTIY